MGVVQERGHKFEVVSQETLIRDELTLCPNTIVRTVYEVESANAFDGVAIVSGNMQDTEAYWTDNHVQAIIRDFAKSGRICAAICCSVPTLAPVATNVRVSYFPLIRSKQRLEDYGAIPQNLSLTVDGNFITAENQMLTQMWAEEICNALEGKPVEHKLHESGFTPKGSERRMLPEVRKAIDEDRGYAMVLNKDKK